MSIREYRALSKEEKAEVRKDLMFDVSCFMLCSILFAMIMLAVGL